MAMTTQQIAELLEPGLREVTGRYPTIPTVWSKIFEKNTSKLAVERTAEMKYLGLPTLKAEGGAITFKNDQGTRFVWSQEHIEVALGYACTRPMIEDNLYQSAFDTSNLGLQDSFAEFKEIIAAAIFNLGTTYDANVGGDGKALFASDHPIDGGTIANIPSVPVELGEGSLLNAQVAISSTFRDNAGLLKRAMPRKLLVPPTLEPVACRLTKTVQRPGTADNDVNAIAFVGGGIPEGYLVNPYFTSPKAWFVLTSIKTLLYLERVAFDTNMWVDDATQNLLVSGRERFSFGRYGWRGTFGSFPT